MYAVLDDRNQQYRVAKGDKIKIHLRSDANEGDTLTFDKVCAVGGEGDNAGKVGTPFVDGASVTAKVLKNVKGPKVIIGKTPPLGATVRKTRFLDRNAWRPPPGCSGVLLRRNTLSVRSCWCRNGCRVCCGTHHRILRRCHRTA